VTSIPDVVRLLSEFALVVFIPMLLWNARLMVDLRDGQRELKQALFGVKGDNGINSEVKALRESCLTVSARVGEHEYKLEAVTHRLASLEGPRP